MEVLRILRVNEIMKSRILTLQDGIKVKSTIPGYLNYQISIILTLLL